MAPEKILYSISAEAIGGREGRASSKNPEFDMKLSTPPGLGGAGGDGTNPEQLFAAGYAACFLQSMKVSALQNKAPIAPDTTVEATVGVGPNGSGGFALQVDMVIKAPSMSREITEGLVKQAHVICPYSNATRGNIPVTFTVV